MKTVEVIQIWNSDGVLQSQTHNGIEQEIPQYFKDNPSICIFDPSPDLEYIKHVTQVPEIELTPPN